MRWEFCQSIIACSSYCPWNGTFFCNYFVPLLKRDLPRVKGNYRLGKEQLCTYLEKKSVNLAYSFISLPIKVILTLHKKFDKLMKRKSLTKKTAVIQGLPSGFDLMYLALADRNMQVRFSLKVVGESWVVEIWPMTLWFG